MSPSSSSTFAVAVVAAVVDHDHFIIRHVRLERGEFALVAQAVAAQVPWGRWANRACAATGAKGAKGLRSVAASGMSSILFRMRKSHLAGRRIDQAHEVDSGTSDRVKLKRRLSFDQVVLATSTETEADLSFLIRFGDEREATRVMRPAVTLRENESMPDRFATIDSAGIFKQFVTAINTHDVETLTSLMTPDHVFVDSVGNRVHGAASMEAGWRSYFVMCPDYRLQTDDVMATGAAVLAVGEAGGTIDGVAWRTPAAWKAVIRDGGLANGECSRTTGQFTKF